MADDIRRSLVYPPACRWGLPGGTCGATEGVRPYPGGHFCPAHTPAARAGEPEPMTPTEIQKRKEQQ